jgi:hypothetical protein
MIIALLGAVNNLGAVVDKSGLVRLRDVGIGLTWAQRCHLKSIVDSNLQALDDEICEHLIGLGLARRKGDALTATEAGRYVTRRFSSRLICVSERALATGADGARTLRRLRELKLWRIGVALPTSEHWRMNAVLSNALKLSGREAHEVWRVIQLIPTNGPFDGVPGAVLQLAIRCKHFPEVWKVVAAKALVHVRLTGKRNR